MEAIHNSSIVTSFTGWLGRMKPIDLSNYKKNAQNECKVRMDLTKRKLEDLQNFAKEITTFVLNDVEEFYERSGINIFKK